MVKPQYPKTIVILGMHRSATSLVAKGLSNVMSMGGNFLAAHPRANPEGFFEDMDFVNLNHEILKTAGGSWFDPPTEQAIMETQPLFDSRIQSLLKQKETKIFGWKDPRTTLTIRLYMPHLINPHFIACFRDPEDVAQSLIRRGDSFTLEKGIRLAKLYNERLLRFLSEHHT